MTNIYIIYYQSDEIYLDTIVEILYLHGLNIVGVTKIPNEKDNYRLTIQSIFFKFKSGGVFYCLGAKGMIPFINSIIESIQFDYQYSFYIQGLYIKYLQSDFLKTSKFKINIYFHHITSHLYYFDQLSLIRSVNEIFVSQILFFILSVFENTPNSVNNANIFLNNYYNMYLNENVNSYYHNLYIKMSRGHYLYQQLYLYKMFINGKNGENKITLILNNPDSFLINNPNMYNYKPICNFPQYNNRIIFNIAFAFSFTGNDREYDINMFLVAYRTLVFLNEKYNIEINGTINKVYYIIYDLKSDEKYCEEVMEKMSVKNITYIFGFAHYCFKYLNKYPNFVIYYPKLLPEFPFDNYLPPNVISFGGKIKQLLHSFPYFVTHFNSHNFFIVYTNSTTISTFIPSLKKYISTYSDDIDTVCINKNDILMNDYITIILSKINLTENKVYTILLYTSYTQTKLFLNSFTQYYEKYKNRIQFYLINSGDKILTIIKPKFKCYSISFYFSNIENQVNDFYNIILNSLTPELSSYGYSISSFDTVFSFFMVCRKVQSFEPQKIFDFYEENRKNTYTFLSGRESLNEYNYLTKHVYIGAYYPEEDKFKVVFDTKTIIDYKPVKYDYNNQLVEIRIPSNTVTNIILKHFFTLLFLCDDNENYYCNNLFELLKSGILLYNNDNTNKYYMFLTKVMNKENEESLLFIKNHLEKGYMTALFISGSENYLKLLKDYTNNSSSSFYIFFLPPELEASLEGIYYKNVVYSSGNVFTFLRHTITHVILESIKFNDEIAIFYYNSTFYNYCSDHIENMFSLYYPLTLVKKFDIMKMINREYDKVNIQNVKVILTVVPIYLEILIQTFSHYNISRSISIIALYYQDILIKNEPKIYYVRSYSKEIKKQWNEDLLYIFNTSMLVTNGIDLEVAMIDIWSTLYRSLYLLESYLNNLAFVHINDRKYNFTLNNNNNDNYLNQDYYLFFYSEHRNENIIQSYGFDIPQDLYIDDTSMMCNWECGNYNNNSYNLSIKVGILYNPYNSDFIQYSSFLLHTILYDILISDTVNGYKIKPYICSDKNYISCDEILKYYEEKEIYFIFGGFFSECLSEMLKYFSEFKQSNLLVFYTGEIDDYYCDKHIIQIGPTPSQIINLLLLKEYNANIPFSIISSSLNQYPKKISQYFRDTFLSLGFEVEVIDIENCKNNISFNFNNSIVIVTLNRDEELELFHSLLISNNKKIFKNCKFIYIGCGEEMVSRFGYSNSEIISTFPPNSYFIDTFFHQLTLITKGTTTFDVSINKDITKIYSTVLGSIYYIPSTSEEVYTSFEIWKEVTTKLDTFDVEEIRRSLYNYGYFGATGPITLLNNNYVSRRMFYGKLNSNLRIIEVIFSPTSQMLPHNIRDRSFICQCQSKNECSIDDYKENYYQIIIIYDESEIKSSIILSVITLLTQINERNTEYMEFNNYERIIITHIIIIRNGKISENEMKKYILDEKTIAMFGCLSSKCKDIVTPIADQYKIPFYFIGNFYTLYSPYTFYFGVDIDSSLSSLIKYLKSIGSNRIIVIESFDNIVVSDHDLDYDFIPLTDVIEKLIDFSSKYKFNLTIDDYYFVEMNETYSNLNYVINELEKINESIVIVNLLYGNEINQFLNKYYNSKILTNIVTNIFLSFNSYDIDEEVTHYLDGNLVIKLYVEDPGSLSSMISAFEFYNTYGNSFKITDSMISLMISVDCIFFSLKELLKIDMTLEKDDKNNKIGKYIRYLSYKYADSTGNCIYYYSYYLYL